MADIKISQLGAAIAVGDTDLLPIVSGGNTLKATAAQVKEHSIGNTNISSIGDGSVTGAINALNTDKQPKTLDTPLTIGGVSKTTVEAALGGLVSENQTLSTKADESDLSSISITGTTNNTGSTISKGTFFYLNGILVKSKVDIANGATLTEDTNYETLSKGALNDLTNKYFGTETPIGIYVNKILYRKIIDIGQLPSSAGVKTINHYITGNFIIRHVYGYASTGVTQVPLPYPNNSTSTISVYVTASKVNIEVFSDRSAYIDGQVVLEYTKD